MTLELHPHIWSYAPYTVAAAGWAGPLKLSTEEVLVWEGVLFHLALLLCARQVVRRREGASGRARERESDRGRGEGGKGRLQEEERDAAIKKKKTHNQGKN